MKRDFNGLKRGEFDVLVIGGGITGAWTAYDAARRGLRVALVEKKDWASGTSSSSSKLVHGGLRYLENFEFSLVRDSLIERRHLTELGPHRVRPLRFALPLYGANIITKPKLKAGLTLYDTLAGSNLPVAKHEMLSRDAMLERYPFISSEDFDGGFTYGDCQQDDARTTLEIVAGAMQFGAVAVNHAKVGDLLFSGERVIGAHIVDRLTGRKAEVRAPVIVNAAGPWSEKLLPGREKPLTRLVKGSHLVMPAMPTDDAFLITSPRDNRVMFLIPWYGRTLLGTTDVDYNGDPDELKVTNFETDYMIEAANHTLGKNFWTREDVLGRYAGVRTLEYTDGSATKASRDWKLDRPVPGMLMPVGGKFTTARLDAEYIVDAIFADLGRPAVECTTGRRPLPWAPLGDFQVWRKTAIDRGMAAGLDKEVASNCAERHGLRLDEVLELIAERPQLAKRLAPELPFCHAEVIHAVRGEMAQTMDDVLRRRIPVVLLGRLDEPTAAALCDELRKEFDWPDEYCELVLQ